MRLGPPRRSVQNIAGHSSTTVDRSNSHEIRDCARPFCLYYTCRLKKKNADGTSDSTAYFFARPMLIKALTLDMQWEVSFEWTATDWRELGTSHDDYRATFVYGKNEQILILGETEGDHHTTWSFNTSSVDDLIDSGLQIMGMVRFLG